MQNIAATGRKINSIPAETRTQGEEWHMRAKEKISSSFGTETAELHVGQKGKI